MAEYLIVFLLMLNVFVSLFRIAGMDKRTDFLERAAFVCISVGSFALLLIELWPQVALLREQISDDMAHIALYLGAFLWGLNALRSEYCARGLLPDRRYCKPKDCPYPKEGA